MGGTTGQINNESGEIRNTANIELCKYFANYANIQPILLGGSTNWADAQVINGRT